MTTGRPMSDTLTETTASLPVAAAREGMVPSGKLGGLGKLGSLGPLGRMDGPGRRGTPSRLVRFGRTHTWWFAGAAWAVFVGLTYVAVGGHLNPYLSLTGLLVGFLVGLTGMGGGALMTPILIFFFGFKPTLAIGTDVTYGAITKTFGAWRHWRLGSVDLPLVVYLCLGSVPSTLLGVGLIHLLQSTYGAGLDSLLYRLIGVLWWSWARCWPCARWCAPMRFAAVRTSRCRGAASCSPWRWGRPRGLPWG